MTHPEHARSRRLLFVCMGNICRSPAAEGVMCRLISERGLDGEVEVDSAGTIGHHVGAPADERMDRAATSRGYELTSRARRIERRDGETFDLVVVADRENLSDTEAVLAGTPAEVRLLSSFLEPDGDWPIDLPDPYYGGADGFETVLDMIEAACPQILDHLLRDHDGGR